jgi:DNA-binding transcriptional regulator YiaG
VKPTERQYTALGNYRDIITQNAPKIADELGVSAQTLLDWTEGKGEPTTEQAEKMLEFIKQANKPA